ncbi:hypothetical protein LIT25_14890 [Bacillus sp. F19]|nr:hypothetical protein LIT25_14890 [Bacillus sp. F19]
MDPVLITNLMRIGLPLIIIAASLFWTMKMPFTKRFVPPVTLALLAAAVFAAPYILEGADISVRDLDSVLLTLYFTLTLMLSSVLSLITALFIKKKENK